jgi:hypothetical protein
MEPFTKHTDQPYEHRDITPTEEQLLAMALANLGQYIHDNSPQYILIEDVMRMTTIVGLTEWKSYLKTTLGSQIQLT